jgi:hypothetical protein
MGIKIVVLEHYKGVTRALRLWCRIEQVRETRCSDNAHSHTCSQHSSDRSSNYHCNTIVTTHATISAS